MRRSGAWSVRVVAALLVLAVVSSLGGCVASRQQPGQASAAVEDALELASSAVATTTLIGLLEENRLPAAVADTAVLDQIGELADATAALTTLVPPDDASAAERAAALTAVAGATAAVVSSRAWVSRAAGGELTDAGDVPADADAAVALLDAAAACSTHAWRGRIEAAARSRARDLDAIGGFVDIGDLVTNAVGARFGLSLVWVVVVGVVGICLFAEMSGRVAAVDGPPSS